MEATIVENLLEAAQTLSKAVDRLSFGLPITHWYNPLAYAWEAHQAYLSTYATHTKRVLFLGMNPGPWGMAQTGVPFGEVSFVRDWLGICKPVAKPSREHPKRPIQGFECRQSEVSGRRLWGFFAAAYPVAKDFFEAYFVANYCPLVFMEASGVNRTPDRLPRHEQTALYAPCDAHLQALVQNLQPRWVVGIGQFAAGQAERALTGLPVAIGSLPHPSPANPAANKGWASLADKVLRSLGIWP